MANQCHKFSLHLVFSLLLNVLMWQTNFECVHIAYIVHQKIYSTHHVNNELINLPNFFVDIKFQETWSHIFGNDQNLIEYRNRLNMRGIWTFSFLFPDKSINSVAPYTDRYFVTHISNGFIKLRCWFDFDKNEFGFFICLSFPLLLIIIMESNKKMLICW